MIALIYPSELTAPSPISLNLHPLSPPLLPPFSLSFAKEKSRQSSLHHAILLKNILFIPTKIQYKNPNIQSGIFRSFPYSRLSAAIYASAAVLICARVLFFPLTSMVYCPSTRKSPVSEYSSSCP